MINMIMSLIMIISMMFMMIKHPLSMVIMIIMQTIMVGLMTGLMIKSFWFSYIIMIIMTSGMLVLFIYMASIASNEKFNFNIKMLMMLLLIPLLFIILYYTNQNTMNPQEMKTILQTLFNYPTLLLTMMMTVYLLFAMITISKIVNINEGPLRIKK
nr:NADH dehydrogenase subunit 6 [Tropidothorax sinensis]